MILNSLMMIYKLILITFTKQSERLNLIKRMKQLSVDVPIDYYGKAAACNGTSRKYFDDIDEYEIHIKDGNNQKP